jgi:uncharacterized protein (AIM24 family)
MQDELLGTTQPVLSISLEPGESIAAVAGEFAWMTDSIQIAAAGDPKREPRLCVYTATSEPGVVAFAAKRPGRILSIEVGGDEGYLVRESGFLAGTPGVQVDADRYGPVPWAIDGHGLALWRIGGSGRAWVELPGDVVSRELSAGRSLRVHPRHIGMLEGTVAIQVAVVPGTSGREDAYPCAVLSGPGAVWLQSMPLNPGGTTQQSEAHA